MINKSENDGFEITYFFKPNFRESEKKRKNKSQFKK